MLITPVLGRQGQEGSWGVPSGCLAESVDSRCTERPCPQNKAGNDYGRPQWQPLASEYTRAFTYTLIYTYTFTTHSHTYPHIHTHTFTYTHEVGERDGFIQHLTTEDSQSCSYLRETGVKPCTVSC